MKAKFRRFTFVRVCKNVPSFMSHFDSDFYAITGDSELSTLRQDGTRIFEYTLYKFENGKVVNELAWYYESQLTALENQDREKYEELVEQYNLHN